MQLYTGMHQQSIVCRSTTRMWNMGNIVQVESHVGMFIPRNYGPFLILWAVIVWGLAPLISREMVGVVMRSELQLYCTHTFIDQYCIVRIFHALIHMCMYTTPHLMLVCLICWCASYMLGHIELNWVRCVVEINREYM